MTPDPVDVGVSFLRGLARRARASSPLVELVRRGLYHVVRKPLGPYDDQRGPLGALTNEAFLRLVHEGHITWQDRAAVFTAAARLIRDLLVDRARETAYLIDSAGPPGTAPPPAAIIAYGPPVALLALDDALAWLARQDRRQAQIVELRYFAGLTVDEIADLLEIPRAEALRDWTFARAWLHRAIASSESRDAL